MIPREEFIRRIKEIRQQHQEIKSLIYKEWGEVERQKAYKLGIALTDWQDAEIRRLEQVATKYGYGRLDA